jgi:hypothetical protein
MYIGLNMLLVNIMISYSNGIVNTVDSLYPKLPPSAMMLPYDEML